MEKKRERIQINKSFGQLAVQVILLLLSIAFLLEFAARTDFIQSRVPFQALGTNNIEFEANLDTLTALTEREGPMDCLFIGNSTIGRAIDPKSFGLAYKDQTGIEIRCFNFSVNGTSVPTSILITKILIKIYQPKLIVFGTSIGEYAAYFHDIPQERYTDNPWFKYQLGQFSLEGWITQHSFAYRILLFYTYSANNGLRIQPTLDQAPDNIKERTNYGFAYTDEVKEDINHPTRDDRERFFHNLGGLNYSQHIASSLEELFKLQDQADIQIVVVELPYHKSLITLYDTPGKFEEKKEELASFYKHISAELINVTSLHNILFLRSTYLFMIPDNGWKDREHLNGIGAAIFSQWLGNQLGAAVVEGALTDPTIGK